MPKDRFMSSFCFLMCQKSVTCPFFDGIWRVKKAVFWINQTKGYNFHYAAFMGKCIGPCSIVVVRFKSAYFFYTNNMVEKFTQWSLIFVCHCVQFWRMQNCFPHKALSSSTTNAFHSDWIDRIIKKGDETSKIQGKMLRPYFWSKVCGFFDIKNSMFAVVL